MNKLTKGSNLRWESSRMMLPEHKEQIIDHHNEKRKVVKPILDESQLQEIDAKITIALYDYSPVVLMVWENGIYNEIRGVIYRIDSIDKTVWIRNDETKKIKFENIISVDFAD